MKKYIFGGMLTLCLLGLIAARPWRKINRSTGIVSTADSTQAAGFVNPGADSIYVEQAALAIMPTKSDSLAGDNDSKDKVKERLEKQGKDLDKQIAEVAAANRTKHNKLNDLVAKGIITDEEINALLSKQKKPNSGESLSQRQAPK